MMLGSAGHYRDYVQCHSRDWETWHTCFNIQRVHGKILFSQQWRIWILVLPWRHQVLCEWQYEKICVGLAYSAQHVAGEDKYQSIERRGCDIWRCWISTTAKKRFCPLVVGFQQSQLSPSLTHIFICYQNRTLTLHSGLGRQCVVIQQHRWWITETNGKAMDSWKVITYHVTIGDIPLWMCLDFTEISSQTLEKKREIDVLQTFLLRV